MNNIRLNIYHLILFCCTLFCLLLLLYNSYSIPANLINENVKNESDFEIKLNRPNFETYLKDLKNDCLKVKENAIGIYICGNDEIVENLIKYTRKENLKTIGKFRYDIHHETFQF